MILSVEIKIGIDSVCRILKKLRYSDIKDRFKR